MDELCVLLCEHPLIDVRRAYGDAFTNYFPNFFMTRRILFVCGSLNQTRQMHQIAQQLTEFEQAFTPYYCDGALNVMRSMALLESSVLGRKLNHRCLQYLLAMDLPIDYKGARNNYDLVLTCSDLVIPKNIKTKKIILVQEGMTDPETGLYRLARAFPFLPRWIASTATTGLSGVFEKFCVASEGYKELFIRKGVSPEKLVVTGIPNFDNCVQYLRNDFPFTHHVLVCTSDSRETFKYENRKRTIRNAVKIADGRQLIFKLHPNESVKRATAEINRYAAGALVYATGNTEHMIANCDVLITRFSSTVYVGLALGKECYSDFAMDELKRLLPIQNGGRSAVAIANVCREMLAGQVTAGVSKEARVSTAKFAVFTQLYTRFL